MLILNLSSHGSTLSIVKLSKIKFKIVNIPCLKKKLVTGERKQKQKDHIYRSIAVHVQGDARITIPPQSSSAVVPPSVTKNKYFKK